MEGGRRVSKSKRECARSVLKFTRRTQSTLLNSEINNIDANIETNTVLLSLLAEVTYADERVALNAVIAGLRADRVALIAVAELVGIEIKGHSTILEQSPGQT